MDRLINTSMGKRGCELLSELILVCLFLCNITQVVMNGYGGNLMGRSKWYYGDLM